MERDVLRAALNAKRAARDEELHVRYVALGGGPPGRSVAGHARLPAVFGAQVVWWAARKGLLSVELQHLKLALRPANRPKIQVMSSGRQPLSSGCLPRAH